MEEELISIIVPVYKVEKYLDKCINSIVSQTYKNLEVILVDDGSPDSCGKMCDEWTQKDTRIKVIHKENGGLSDARNFGLDCAKGKYIQFVDSDDYIEKDMIEFLYKNLKENNADISICSNYMVDEENVINVGTRKIFRI
ncbi:MAG: glycosyltransferase [Clostridia bacterium]|nr:glycosyltransferase [Clostridia bacterium]